MPKNETSENIETIVLPESPIAILEDEFCSKHIDWKLNRQPLCQNANNQYFVVETIVRNSIITGNFRNGKGKISQLLIYCFDYDLEVVHN